MFTRADEPLGTTPEHIMPTARAFQGPNGWYVASEDCTGSHRQPHDGGHLDENAAKRDAARRNSQRQHAVYVSWPAEPTTCTPKGRALYDVTYSGYASATEAHDEGVSDPVVGLTPRNGGDMACSDIDTSDYAYTHGGRAFRAACDRARAIREEMGASVSL